MTRSDPLTTPCRLLGSVQNYAWGKVGSSSKVAQLWAAGTSGVVKPTDPYAELWMGTHPSGPSTAVLADGTKQPLSELVRKSPELLGDVAQEFDGDLPFLFKVLSVNKALSIQAHPNRTLAKVLHASHPEHYKDANHKPEMMIALGRFEALCGFRSASAILAFMQGVPELRAVTSDESYTALYEGQGTDSGVREGIRATFSALMNAPSSLIVEQLTLLLRRLTSGSDASGVVDEPLRELILRLFEQYPGDIGIFCVFYLNYLVLEDGEAVFLAANVPHAYISGDCIECMATSDNVVRVGLTPKYRDVETLLSMLDYSPTPQQQLRLASSRDNNQTGLSSRLFAPPVPEFSVQAVRVREQAVPLEAVNGPSIIIFTDGEATVHALAAKAVAGTVLFVPANSSTVVEGTCSFYRAMCVRGGNE